MRNLIDSVMRTHHEYSQALRDGAALLRKMGSFTWEGNGPLFEFYECPASWVPKDGFGTCKKLFGPFLVGVNPPVRDGSWSIAGSIPVVTYQPPMFLMVGPPLWWLYDGVKESPIGERVPKEYQGLELLDVLSAYLVEERIMHGSTPFS